MRLLESIAQTTKQDYTKKAQYAFFEVRLTTKCKAFMFQNTLVRSKGWAENISLDTTWFEDVTAALGFGCYFRIIFAKASNLNQAV